MAIPNKHSTQFDLKSCIETIENDFHGSISTLFFLSFPFVNHFMILGHKVKRIKFEIVLRIENNRFYYGIQSQPLRFSYVLSLCSHLPNGKKSSGFRKSRGTFICLLLFNTFIANLFTVLTVTYSKNGR